MKRTFPLIAVVVLAVVFIVSLLCVLNPEYKEEYQVVSSDTVNLDEASYYGLDVSGNHYVSNNEDPQISIPCISSSINAVTIDFAEPFSADEYVQIYYAVNNEGLSEPNSVSQLISSGDTSATVLLSDQVYTSLRLDLSGDYYIDSVKLEYINVIMEMLVNVPAVILLVLSAAGIVLLFVFFRKDIIGSVAGIRTGFFSSAYDEPKKSAGKMANLYAVIALIAGFAIIYLMPPGTAPDENAHLSNIYRMGNGGFFGQTEEVDGQLIMGDYLTQDEIDYIKTFGTYNGVRAERYSYVEAYSWSYLHDNNAGRLQFMPEPHANLNPMSYLPASFAVFLAKKLFGITSAYNLAIIAKFTNLFLAVIVIRLAIKNTPVLRNTMFLIALFPMTLQQCASTSYDVLSISGGMLLFAYGMKLVVGNDDVTVGKKDIAAICFACAEIFGSKIAYVPFMLILLAIPIKKFGSLKKYFMCIGMVVATGLVFYFIPNQISQNLLSGCDNAVLSPLLEKQREYFIENLGIVPHILFNTAMQMREFWLTSGFAQLGWLDTPFPKPYILISLIFTFLVALFETSKTERITWKVRTASVLGVIIFYVGLVLNSFVTWTPMDTNQVGGDYATGIQGRYFLPMLMFVPIIAANPFFTRFMYRGNTEAFVESASIVSGMSFAVMTIIVFITRYWC